VQKDVILKQNRLMELSQFDI